jgi:uncharacterized membrane protein YbhN (UPF0104 family)
MPFGGFVGIWRSILAMHIKFRKLFAASGISVVLIAGLLWAADWSLFVDTQLRLSLVFVAMGSYFCGVGFRAASLRTLAPVGLRGAWRDWFRLAARHQFVFSLMPSGMGDIGFPFLAKHYTAVQIADAVRMIAQFRLRDAFVLILFAVVGLVLQTFSYTYALVILAVSLALLYWMDDFVLVCLRGATRLLSAGRITAFLQLCDAREDVAGSDRALRMCFSIATWAFVTTGMYYCFAAVGKTIPLGEVLLMLAIMNAVGAIAISIAGFGIAEAGMASTLIMMGEGVASAAATALVVRPLLLFCMVGASVLLDLSVTAFRISRNLGAKH